MSRHQHNDSLLRNALTANGLFSALSGIACVAASHAIAGFLFDQQFELLGLAPHGVIMALGFGLILFAGFVFWTARQKFLHTARARAITAMDLGWVLGTGALLFAASEPFSGPGLVALLVIAVVVLLFAVEQTIGIATIYQGTHAVSTTTRGDTLTLTATATTDATPERVWQVMRDHERYADVADNIGKVEVVSGNGVGMVRKCFDTSGKSWSETCTRWEEGRAFAFRVHTEAEDYPYPIAKLSGEWALSPHAEGTRIHLIFRVTAKPGLINRLLFKAMAAPFSAVCDRLLSNWIAVMEGTAIAPPSAPTEERGAQLA